jgi:PAS domain S-box-containing protein
VTLRRLWSIPEVTDPALRREVRLLFGVTRPLLVGYLVAAPLFLVPGVTEAQAGVASTVLLAASALPFAWALFLAHQGRVALASWLVIATGLATQMGSVALFGGVRGVVAGSLVLSVLVAGVLRGWRASALTAGVAGAFVLVEVGLEAAGLAPLLLPQMVSGAAVVTLLTMLAISAALLALYARELALAAGAAQEAAATALASEQRLAEMVREAPDGFLVLDAEGRLLSCNPAVLSMTGWSEAELVGRRLTELPGVPTPESRREMVESVARARAEGAGGATVDLVRKDGAPLVIETRIRRVDRPDGAAVAHVVVRDVTARVQAERERTRLEADLLDARRMEGVGRLAGGIAHDFRNLLTPVLANASLLAEGQAADAAEAAELARDIQDAAQKASALTGQLLAFARRQRLDPRALDLAEVLCGLEPILRRLIREDVRLRFDLAPGLPAVRADRSQLEQVVVNLVANARDAMPEGGEVTVTTRLAEVGDAEAAARPGARPGRHLVLAVADTGVGMTEEVRQRIFDPFFTTKEPGAGTGLGLATVQGVVAQGGGHVRVESAPGFGATFSVFLPADDGPAEVAPPPPARPPALPADLVALVVDDAALPRAVIARALRRQGLEVREAGDATEALELARTLDRPLDLLVTDVVMPGLSGPALAERVRALHPGARVILVSGYSDQAVDLSRLGGGARFLGKPFTPAELLGAVGAALAEPR